MCVNQRWITNKYTGNRFLVKCGKCKSCLQEKAVSSTNRIRREFDGQRIALFVTLTYDRISCPYVLESDLLSHNMILPIYRDYSVHRSARTGKYKRVYGLQELDRVVLSPDDENYFVGRYSWLKHQPHKIGVPFYKDFQNFIKRLRVNCSRSLISHEGFSLFGCSEVGPKTKRPHFHFLMFIRPSDESFYRSAILQAWPFASQRRTSQYIEIARDPASYVASYVNCRKTISPFFAKYFNVKHSFSKYFGLSDQQFSLSSLLQKVDEGNLSYVVQRNKQGIRENVDFLIPFYVINRYFPSFKGYSRLTSDEVSYNIRTIGKFLSLSDYPKSHPQPRYRLKINYTADDLNRIHVRLRNAYEYYHNITGGNICDYAIDYERIRRCYKSNLLKRSYESDNLALYEHFDNIYEVNNGQVVNDYILSYIREFSVPLDPNDFPCNRDSTSRMSLWFDLYDKEKKVSNEIMSFNNHYV